MDTKSVDDTGIVQVDYLLAGKIQNLHYRKTSAGIFIYGSSSVVSMTNQIETVIKFLISEKIMDENHTLTGKCLYYRDSDKQWNPVSFGRGKNGLFVDWPGSPEGPELLSDEEMADLIEKTVAKPRSRFPLRRNHASRVVGW